MAEIDDNMQFGFNNWAHLLNRYIINIFMKSILYFYDVHIQDKVIINENGMDRKKIWLVVLTTLLRTVQPMDHESGANFYSYYTLV